MPWNLIIAVVMLIVSFAITALTTKSPKPERPQSITDFTFPQSAEGQPQAVIFGDVWSPDHQILWYGNFRNSEIKQTTSKKG
jgi:hypothetical protein